MLQPLVRMIQDSAVLDKVAGAIQPSAKRAFRQTSGAGRSLKDFLSGTWVGHPLHPILKDIPIGGWTMAAIFDTLDAFRRDAALQRASDISVATGVAGALASAITGLADWSDTNGRARRVGAAHAALNVTAVGLYGAALAARVRGSRSSGVALAYTGYGVMLLGAYLGGHLVFGQQIGVNHAAQSHLPAEFLGVLPDADLIEGRPQRVQYKTLPVVLVRRGVRVHALYEKCAHMAGPLAKGTIEDGSIRCPWHGSRFSLEDGRVLEGPATNPQPCFETRVVNGTIEIRAREPESP